MPENKKRVNVYIPMETYVKVTQSGYSLTDAITQGLETFLEIKPEGKPDISEYQEARIEDLKSQIQGLNNQLHIKDEQIKDQSENMHKQAVHIQSLIQENSKLNIKLLPENTENKKSWWKFW